MRTRISTLLAVALLLGGMGAAEARIQRSAGVVKAFRSQNACPATDQHRGACPGWQVDHVRPLCMGGPDAMPNLQWLSVPDHRFKTFVDVRECRKWARMAATPAH